MKNSTLRWFIIASSLLLLFIFSLQSYWLLKAYQQESSDFSRRVTNALRVVAERILKFNKNPQNQLLKPVEQKNLNYFTVQINDSIEPTILVEFLKQEFQKHDILQDFTYGIYDCGKDQIIYGGFVCQKLNCDSTASVKYEFPKLPYKNYYFGVYFPKYHGSLIGELKIWILSFTIIMILVGFFGYAILVILRQKKLSEIQTDFINNMTHEFKTPISTILLSADVLAQPSILTQPIRLQNYSAIIRKEAERLKKNVDSVLQLANITSQSKGGIDLKKIDLGDFIEKWKSDIQILLEEKEAVLEIDLPKETVFILADTLHLNNVFYNLLDNSLKYNDKNPKIWLKLIHKKNATIIWSDNGIGISEKNLAHVFEKFYRVPTGNIHNVKGFGLGLYYVKEILVAQKATIKIASEVEKGTIFTITFPTT